MKEEIDNKSISNFWKTFGKQISKDNWLKIKNITIKEQKEHIIKLIKEEYERRNINS